MHVIRHGHMHTPIHQESEKYRNVPGHRHADTHFWRQMQEPRHIRTDIETKRTYI
jgi:hypothetical protein